MVGGQSDSPVQVTLCDLRRLRACTDARDAFAEMFPDGTSYRQLLLALADHPKGLIWWEFLALRVSPLHIARDAYEAQRLPIADAYDAQRRQIMDAYNAQTLPIEEAYWTRICTIDNVFDPQMLPISAAHEAQIRQIREACDTQLHSIWEASDTQLRSALRSVAEVV